MINACSQGGTMLGDIHVHVYIATYMYIVLYVQDYACIFIMYMNYQVYT